MLRPLLAACYSPRVTDRKVKIPPRWGRPAGKQGKGRGDGPCPYFQVANSQGLLQPFLPARRQIQHSKCSSILPPSFFFFFFFNADYKATAKNISSTIKHQMVTPFPQLVWVKTVKLYPCFSSESPGVQARQAQHRALVLLLFVPGLALFLALDTIQPPFSIVCHFTYGSSAPNVCMYPENAAFHYVFSM